MSEEEQTEIPASDEPNTAVEVAEDTAPADAPSTEDSPSAKVEGQSDVNSEAQEPTADQDADNTQTVEDPPTEDTTAPATEVDTTKGEDGAEEEANQGGGSEQPKPEEGAVGEAEKEGENGEGKEETEGEPNTVEENEDNGKEMSGSQPDPDASENPEQVADEAGEESALPESSTFTDGERPETPVVAVTDPLSREGSPVQDLQLIPLGTPERLTSPVIEYEEYDDEEGDYEQMMSREELIECYQAALTEREQLQTTNTQFQHKLAEYFKKKKTDDQRQEMDKNVTDQEQRYLKYMSNLEELRKQEEEERENLHDQEEDLSNKKDEKLALVDGETNHFAEFKKQTALNAINSRTGKPILPKDVEQYLLNEVKKEDEVKQVRLDNIKLKNRLKKREQQLKAKEELAEGLHLIDFEQLKIENQTYNEKIEERNEELLKLRKKITSTVQVLTHVKEKLQFVQAENQVQKSKLRDVEEFVGKKRDILSRTKKARDKLRIDNQRQMQKCGLLGNKPLLRDFEERKDEGDDLRARLEYLKRQHAELTLDSNGLRRKIEEARSVRN